MATDITPPIVADLGRARTEHVRQLSAGSGPLLDDIAAAMACVQANPELKGAERVFVPVVVIYTPAEDDDGSDQRAAT